MVGHVVAWRAASARRPVAAPPLAGPARPAGGERLAGRPAAVAPRPALAHGRGPAPAGRPRAATGYGRGARRGAVRRCIDERRTRVVAQPRIVAARGGPPAVRRDDALVRLAGAEHGATPRAGVARGSAAAGR